MDANSWTDVVSALAAAVGALAAVVAVVVALAFGIKQAREAGRLRRERAQPYVVMHATENPTSWRAQDLVVENFGATGAYDVRIEATPPLQRVGLRSGDLEAVKLPERLPFLAPGQQWRTLWDFAFSVAEAQEKRPGEVPDVYDVRVTYCDSTGREHSTESVLDWRTVMARRTTTRKDVQDVAEAVDRIGKTLAAWGDGDAVMVSNYDGRRREAVERADGRERRRLGAHGSAMAHRARRQAGVDYLPAPTVIGRAYGAVRVRVAGWQRDRDRT